MLSKKDYKLIKIVKSRSKNKKYTAFLENRETGDMKKIHFGDSRYQQFFDKLGVYTHLNHNDEKRRKNYIKRHSVNSFEPYSANYFSLKYLW
jgi:hypothetical protein